MVNFQMNLNDFCTNFDSIQFTHLTPSSQSEEVMKTNNNPKISWKLTFYHGEWIPGYTAGGCGNSNNSFWTNPQYLVKITDVDKEDAEDKASIIVTFRLKNANIYRPFKRQLSIIDKTNTGFYR